MIVNLDNFDTKKSFFFGLWTNTYANNKTINPKSTKQCKLIVAILMKKEFLIIIFKHEIGWIL